MLDIQSFDGFSPEGLTSACNILEKMYDDNNYSHHFYDKKEDIMSDMIYEINCDKLYTIIRVDDNQVIDSYPTMIEAQKAIKLLLSK